MNDYPHILSQPLWHPHFLLVGDILRIFFSVWPNQPNAPIFFAMQDGCLGTRRSSFSVYEPESPALYFHGKMRCYSNYHIQYGSSVNRSKGKIFHCTLMAPIWFQGAILLPTSECHLNISQRENARGGNESWVIFHSETLTLAECGYRGLTPPQIHHHIRQTWQGVNNDSIAQYARGLVI